MSNFYVDSIVMHHKHSQYLMATQIKYDISFFLNVCTLCVR